MKSDLLTARRVAQIMRNQEWGWHHDGRGLYLVGSTQYCTFSWTLRIYRNTVTGKPRDMGLGSARDLTLAKARARAQKFREEALDGDPVEARRKARDEARAGAADRLTFREAAAEYIELHNPTWRSAKHRKQWADTLKDYAYPTLGTRPIAAIDNALITDALAPIWIDKAVTARRTRQRIKKVIQWIKDGKPLPQGGARRVEHLAASPIDEAPGHMAKLRDRQDVPARALEFTILTAARSGEALGAKWAELDLDAGVWTVPAARMKGGKEHEVPLSGRVLEILDALPRGEEYVFPGGKAGRPLHDKSLRMVLRDIGGDGLTVHGFRSTFRDWAGDRTSFARDVIEFALAHKLKDKTEASYRRSAALEKRRRLMEAWAAYCATSTSPKAVKGKVVNLHGEAA